MYKPLISRTSQHVRPKGDGLDCAPTYSPCDLRSEISDDLKLQAQNSSLWPIGSYRFVARCASALARALRTVLIPTEQLYELNKNFELRLWDWGSQTVVTILCFSRLWCHPILCIVEQQWLEARALQVLVGMHEQTAVEGLDAMIV